jgi:hypothetical protein
VFVTLKGAHRTAGAEKAIIAGECTLEYKDYTQEVGGPCAITMTRVLSLR